MDFERIENYHNDFFENQSIEKELSKNKNFLIRL